MPAKKKNKKGPRKVAPKGPSGMSKPMSPGVVMVDEKNKEWKIGPVIGQGGFSYLFLGKVIFLLLLLYFSTLDLINLYNHI